jgi:hypothetical protein
VELQIKQIKSIAHTRYPNLFNALRNRTAEKYEKLLGVYASKAAKPRI